MGMPHGLWLEPMPGCGEVRSLTFGSHTMMVSCDLEREHDGWHVARGIQSNSERWEMRCPSKKEEKCEPSPSTRGATTG